MATTKIEASNIATGAVPSTGFNSVQVFTAASTWTRPTDITKVIIEVQGGGGGGGRASLSTWHIGGSAGGYAKKFIDVRSVTNSVIAIGAGGAGKSVSGAGADGGDSSWVDTASGGSSTVTGVKGVGAYANYGTAVGGLATGGDINIQGGAGRCCSYGAGGDSMFGVGGWNGWTGEGIAVAGSGYGAGGGGGYSINSLAGSAGLVIVWEYK